MDKNNLVLLILSVCALSCDPLTRQDRATVGPEQTPIAGDTGTTDSGTSPEQTTASSASETRTTSDDALVERDWEKKQSDQCQAGNPAGCSALAYDALRMKQFEKALSFFLRGCLIDKAAEQCADLGTTGNGSARSCYELASIYQSQGNSAEASQFKACACARSFKPACTL